MDGEDLLLPGGGRGRPRVQFPRFQKYGVADAFILGWIYLVAPGRDGHAGVLRSHGVQVPPGFR